MTEELRVNPSTRFDHVGRTGIYPVSGPLPPGDAPVRGQGELAHPEERVRVFVRRTEWLSNAALLLIGLGGVSLLTGVRPKIGTLALVGGACLAAALPEPWFGIRKRGGALTAA
jgi:hypothetical protein